MNLKTVEELAAAVLCLGFALSLLLVVLGHIRASEIPEDDLLDEYEQWLDEYHQWPRRPD